MARRDALTQRFRLPALFFFGPLFVAALALDFALVLALDAAVRAAFDGGFDALALLLLADVFAGLAGLAGLGAVVAFSLGAAAFAAGVVAVVVRGTVVPNRLFDSRCGAAETGPWNGAACATLAARAASSFAAAARSAATLVAVGRAFSLAGRRS